MLGGGVWITHPLGFGLPTPLISHLELGPQGVGFGLPSDTNRQLPLGMILASYHTWHDSC